MADAPSQGPNCVLLSEPYRAAGCVMRCAGCAGCPAGQPLLACYMGLSMLTLRMLNITVTTGFLMSPNCGQASCVQAAYMHAQRLWVLTVKQSTAALCCLCQHSQPADLHRHEGVHASGHNERPNCRRQCYWVHCAGAKCVSAMHCHTMHMPRGHGSLR
jgi:hypothetical protein